MDQVAADDVTSTTTTTNTSQGINTAADLARLRNNGKLLTPQELKELNARVKALEEMARIEDRLRALESRKRPRSEISEDAPPPEGPVEPVARLQPSTRGSRSPSSHQDRLATIRPSIELDDSDSGSSNTVVYPRKRQRFTRGIKVTPSYTLKVSSSLREWGDWKKDMERVFRGDPYTYQTGSQRILKALDYVDPSLKSLWYTYDDQQGGIGKWATFVNWTRDNIQNGQNATATLYEQLNAAKQLPEKSPVQFNAYLSAIERDLPQQDEKASAMTFYSKLTTELKRQFQTSDIPIPETRAKCVAVAQRIWEGLYRSDNKKESYKSSKEKDHSSTSSKYPRIDSKRDRKDRYHRDHRYRNDRNKERTRATPEKEQLICYKCNKPGHYANNCPDQKEPSKKAKVQSTRRKDSQSRASSRPSSRPSSRSSSRSSSRPSSQPSSRSSSEAPRTLSDSDSSDSLN